MIGRPNTAQTVPMSPATIVATALLILSKVKHQNGIDAAGMTLVVLVVQVAEISTSIPKFKFQFRRTPK